MTTETLSARIAQAKSSEEALGQTLQELIELAGQNSHAGRMLAICRDRVDFIVAGLELALDSIKPREQAM